MLWKNMFVSRAAPAARLLAQRPFHSSAVRANDWFGSMTQNKEGLEQQAKLAKNKKDSKDVQKADGASESKVPAMKDDKELQEYITQQKGVPEAGVSKYGTELKQRLWDAYKEQHQGYDKTKQVTVDGKQYQMVLSPNEIKAFEPSVYCKSFRLDGTWKKAQPLLRMLRKMDVHQAITQCQFSAKRIGRPVAELLQRGVSDAKEMGLSSEDLYIDEIWVGSDPRKFGFVDPKGRGRAGRKRAEYIHVRAILRTSETLKREALERHNKWLAKKPVFQHETRKVGDGYLKSDYRW
ncbi:54S ribosomal protein L22 [Yarrowia sp. C11]|nr:54S ribosomal protein L22 [Yarrowia sp. C11]KAG5370828.1 54S ribosomal protein L22 [Yarrowia sp. E02]